MTTICEALWEARSALEEVSDAPDLDAERLLVRVLDADDNSWLLAHGDEALSPSSQRQFERLVAERATGKPLAYILGAWEFYGREFYVTEDVLVPRPATEHIIDTAMAVVSSMYKKSDRPLVVADVGTGSGCIGITLALELANLQILATDISEAALTVARRNAERHGVADMIEFVREDMATTLRRVRLLRQAQSKQAHRGQAQGKRRHIDLIVSNPPYVPSAELRQLADAKAGCAKETTGLTFEPRGALDGGKDGRAYVRQIEASGIPAVYETVGGKIDSMNIPA